MIRTVFPYPGLRANLGAECSGGRVFVCAVRHGQCTVRSRRFTFSSDFQPEHECLFVTTLSLTLPAARTWTPPRRRPSSPVPRPAPYAHAIASGEHAAHTIRAWRQCGPRIFFNGSSSSRFRTLSTISKRQHWYVRSMHACHVLIALQTDAQLQDFQQRLLLQFQQLQQQTVAPTPQAQQSPYQPHYQAMQPTHQHQQHHQCTCRLW